MFWILVTIAVTALIIWRFYFKPYNYWKDMGIPQTSPWIFLGDSWPTMLQRKGLIEWMDWLYYMYPDSKLTGMYQFYLPTLIVKDPDLIKQLAVKDFDHFTDHNNFSIDEEIDVLWSKNLFALKGQRWRDMRSLLSGSFTSSKMKVMYSLISEESEKFVKKFLKEDKDLLHVELKDTFTKYTNDVIASTSFGIKVDSLENPENEFFQMGKKVSNPSGIIVFIKIFGIMLFPWLFKLLKIGFLPRRVQKFFTGLINDTIKIREERGIVRPDMINLLLEVRRGKKTEETDIPDSGFAVVQESIESSKPSKKQIQITNMDIASQAMVFFLAGFDSVATAMCYTCYELATNPDVQDKLRKEITDIFEESNGKPSYENLLGMDYMDMVVSESLRKWPVAPVTDRVCVKPYTLNQPTSAGKPTLTLKKADSVWIPVYNIHHDPRYYTDPEKFIPERFSEENRTKINPYIYMPFGVGPRACIGSRFALLEIKSLLFHLLNSFEIVPTEKTPIPLNLNMSITFTPVGGFPLGLKRIKMEQLY